MNYKPAAQHWVDLIEKFRIAFLHQDRAMAYSCFLPESEFGLHLGGTLDDYMDYEMEEFRVKCSFFGLDEHGPMAVYELSPEHIYFYFGNQNDPALFEAVWVVDPIEKKLKGNNSLFRWEPKLQNIKTKFGHTTARVVNVKSKTKRFLKWWTIKNRETCNPHTEIMDLEEIMGGFFTACCFEESDPGLVNSYWADFRVKDNLGDTSYQKVWMRGWDHPLANADAWPEVDLEAGVVKDSPNTKTLVILCVDFVDGDRKLFKYPKEKIWDFGKPIQQVCVTDGLSYDWIVKRD